MSRQHFETLQHTPVLSKADDLANIPMLWKVYTNLHIKRRDGGVEKWVRENSGNIKSRHEDESWRHTPLLKGYVELHNGFADEKNIPSSCEVLMDLLFKRGTLPIINTFVDIYNVVSIVTGVSIGAHDTGNIVGNPRLEILREDMSFKPIGGRGEGLARRGEYAYVDDGGPMCRMDIKQCDRTKITGKTTQVLVIFQGHEGVGEDILRESIHRLDEALRRFRVVG
ncbi:MAG: hypothetical protein JRK53_06880 [Deltaproteobacteria bacterium]|nr:hypothetical protein [Deltaproteobacteria bacterium]